MCIPCLRPLQFVQAAEEKKGKKNKARKKAGKAQKGMCHLAGLLCPVTCNSPIVRSFKVEFARAEAQGTAIGDATDGETTHTDAAPAVTETQSSSQRTQEVHLRN